MACPHCGSQELRADRSLAGRLVCGRCGRPLSGRSLRNQGRTRAPARRRRRWILVGLVLGTVALVALQQGADRRSSPWLQPPPQQSAP